METNSLFHKLVQNFSKKYSERESLQMATWLLKDGYNLKPNNTAILNHSIIEKIEQNAKEILQGIPFDYVLGHSIFYGLKFYVNESVLIPRPETELLVEQAIIFLKNKHIETPKILDIGTGSGCIPITLSKNIANAQITSVDISQGALKVAKKNATFHEVEIDFRQLDFLCETNKLGDTDWDLIISNPPYILASEKALMSKSTLEHEPSIALFAKGNDPLIFYRKIALFAYENLGEKGLLLLELNEFKAEEIKSIVQTAGFKSIEILRDLSNKLRILKARLIDGAKAR